MVVMIGGGSSPLTRGKRGGFRGGLAAWRLIPAHAGKTIALEGWGAVSGGSSPLTRGKR